MPGLGHTMDQNLRDLSVRTRLELAYSPWAVSMMESGTKTKMKLDQGGPTGGGRSGGGDGDGDGGGGGGGGGGEDGGSHEIFLLPYLTLAYAAVNMAYCIVTLVEDEAFDLDFFKVGTSLTCLLVLCAFRLSRSTGELGYLLGLGSSLAIMLWTADRCYSKRDVKSSGVVSVLSAGMSFIFMAALNV
eukprot:jgi/Mesen1/6080/ME000031S05349